jgi:hypothetical protein
MQNENKTEKIEETPKSSKLKKLGKGIVAAGFYGIPTGIVVASTYYTIKTQMINYETAKLNLEAAKQAIAQ